MHNICKKVPRWPTLLLGTLFFNSVLRAGYRHHPQGGAGAGQGREAAPRLQEGLVRRAPNEGNRGDKPPVVYLCLGIFCLLLTKSDGTN